MSSLNDDIVRFVKDWNIKYPIDVWWRRKHKIPFNSDTHRKHSLIDMRIEYEEDVLYNEAIKEEIGRKVKEKEDAYIPGYGTIFKKKNSNTESRKMSTQEIEKVFDNIDLSNIEEGEDNEIII